MDLNDDDSVEDAKPAAKQYPTEDVSTVRDPPSTTPASGEIPFLITHWLAGFSKKQSPQNPAAVAAIRDATTQLADAFSSLGAFGHDKQAMGLPGGTSERVGAPNPLTYAAMKRTWTQCPSDHLQTLLEASKETTVTLESCAKPPPNFFQHCLETQTLQRKKPSAGRTLDEAIPIDSNVEEEAIVNPTASLLQKPALLALKDDDQNLDSALHQASAVSSTAMRAFLDARAAVRSLESEVRMHERSLDYNRQLMLSMEEEHSRSSARTVAQLEQKLPALQLKLSSIARPKLMQTQALAIEKYHRHQQVASRFRHPVTQRPDYRNNAILHTLQQRSVTGRTSMRIIHNALLHHRFSHLVTINTHLNYPVYCLKFDATGRYFVTGADDFLVKVFQIVKEGAVLVCTLKGHAGVINDLGISSDNAFLATAGDDGDCRVWGLRDGCPVAILRGHNGGATMVSWSALVPHQLITTGADGLARTWDIRKACLHRYSQWIGSRPEYTYKLGGKVWGEAETERSQASDVEAAIPVPPLPDREEDSTSVAGIMPADPILPEPQPANVVAAPALNNIPLVEPGQFVANALIDQGVELVSTYQHGEPVDENAPGTRASQSTVKVICVSRSPSGSHFATGSDDGVCRVWPEEESFIVESIDHAASDPRLVRSTKDITEKEIRRYSKRGNQPLLTLKGHSSTVTDIAYSNDGDRLLSASQNDGVVRIWSWGCDPAQTTQPSQSIARTVTSITIKLTKPTSQAEARTQRQGPRGKNKCNTDDLISCDVACWLNDDTKIMTSQCEHSRQRTHEVVPGSQHIFLWDANTGNCLMGIASAHTSSCSVVLPHPVLASVFCSAASDGLLKVWDWESGNCLFSHKNVALTGPIEPSERGRCFGFLDGHFSPDGTSLVLSDDGGRVIVFDSCRNHPTSSPPPDWMKEQYYSNDYYDLYYDGNGYCVERGSEMPPHLAPKGSRCTHSGVAFPSELHDRFRKLSGPIPVDERDCRVSRQLLRERSEAKRSSQLPKRANMVGRFDPSTTKVFNKEKIVAGRDFESGNRQGAPGTPGARGVRSANQLSSNWRWRDYDDIERELGNDDAEPDSDDEEFDPSETRRSAVRVPDNMEGSDSEDNLEELDLGEEAEERRTYARGPSRGPNRGGRAEPSDDEDSIGEFAEYMSTNNTPSGPFVADYDFHSFRLPSRSMGEALNREWVRRNESTSSFEGRKTYTPQVGDFVVYIPRVHFETLKEFPSLEAPWVNWPTDVSWPAVKCRVCNIRYRFPFVEYRNDCRSVVAKLTLELVGVPKMSPEHGFPWPSPIFTPPSTLFIFELSLFENEFPEFVIPWGLYEKRLTQLEGASSSSSNPAEIHLEAFFEESGSHQDSMLVSYNGTFAKFEEDTSDEFSSRAHLSGSGYRSVQLRWEGDRRIDFTSPWEVSVRTPAEFVFHVERPRLTEEETRSAREALKEIRSITSVSEFFGQPVVEAYSDYNCRIEVPMDLSFISNRLEAGYYSNGLSVAADVRLILTNCVKYNGENDSLTVVGRQMVSAFESKFLGHEVTDHFHQFDTPLPGPRPRIPVQDFRNDFLGAPTESAQRQRPRTAESVSVLESVATQPQNESIRRSTRNVRPPRGFHQEVEEHALRRSSRARTNSRRLARQESVLALAQAPPVRTLEHLSSSRQRSRGRSPGSGRRGRMVAVPRRELRGRLSARQGLRNSAPQHVEALTASAMLQVDSPVSDRQNNSNQDPRRSSRLAPSENLDENALSPSTTSIARSRNARHSDDPTLPTEQQPQIPRIRISTRRVGPSQTEERERRTNAQNSDPEHRFEGNTHQNPAHASRRSARTRHGSDTHTGSSASNRVRRGSKQKRVVLSLSEDSGDSDGRSDQDEEDHPTLRKNSTRRRSSGDESSFDGANSEQDEESNVEDDLLSEEEETHSNRLRASRKRKYPTQQSSEKRSAGDDSLSDGPKSEPDDESDFSADFPTVAKKTRSNNQRASRKAKQKKHPVDDESSLDAPKSEPDFDESSVESGDSSVDQDTGSNARRTSARKRKRPSDTSYQNIAGRSPRRADRKKRGRVVVKPTRAVLRTANRKSKKVQRPERASAAGDDLQRRSRTPKSYVDPSSSEFDDESSVDPSPPKQRARVPVKGKGESSQPLLSFSSNSAVFPATKRNINPKKRKQFIDQWMHQFELAVWPEIAVGHIPKVTKELIARFQDLDESKLFEAPVVSKHPEITDAYLAQIDFPMDFQSILEERIHSYSTVRELQEDLILVFGNCMAFNEDTSPFHDSASMMMEMLDSTFDGVCSDMSVRPLRH